jgi:hypothetical protein
VTDGVPDYGTAIIKRNTATLRGETLPPPIPLILTELTLPWLLLRTVIGRRSDVIAVEPFLPQLKDPLEKLLHRLAQRTRNGNHVVRELGPKLAPFYAEQAGVPSAIQSWIERYFGFGVSEPPGDYALPYRKACHKYIIGRANHIFALRLLAPNPPRVTGMDDDLVSLYQAFFKTEQISDASFRLSHRIFSVAIIVIAFCASLVAIVGRFRLRVARRPVFSLVDRMIDARDGNVFEDLRLEGHPVCYLARTTADLDSLRQSGLPSESYALRYSGCFGPSTIIDAIETFVRDFIGLIPYSWNKHPRLCYDLIVLPRHRILIRADLSSHPCRCFWSRDEYNTEHILRTQELHRIGAVSLGIQHGVPILGRDAHAWRYLLFDTFFVSGDWVRQEVGGAWSPDMNVRVCGSFGLTKKILQALRPLDHRPKSILLYTNLTSFALTEAIIHRLCEEFPSRKIYLKVKVNWREMPEVVALRKNVARYPNVIDTTEDAYDLMDKGNIVLSTASSVVLEAVQAGLPAFVIDDVAWPVRLCYRSTPYICIASAEIARQRVHEMDADPKNYPWAALRELVPLDGRNFEDALRQELQSISVAAPTASDL